MFFFPETNGRTLEEMDELFGGAGGLAAAEEAHLAEINRRIGLDTYANVKDRREDALEKHDV